MNYVLRHPRHLLNYEGLAVLSYLLAPSLASPEL